MLYFDRLKGREAFASRPFRSGLPLFLRLVYDFDGYARNLSVFAVTRLFSAIFRAASFRASLLYHAGCHISTGFTMFLKLTQTVVKTAPRRTPASRKERRCASPCAAPLQSVDFFQKSQYTLFPTIII